MSSYYEDDRSSAGGARGDSMNPVPRLDLSSTTGGRRTHAPPSHSARRSTASGGLKASRRTSARGYHSARRAATNSGRTSNTMKGMSRSQTARNREDTDAWGNRYPYANRSLQPHRPKPQTNFTHPRPLPILQLSNRFSAMGHTATQAGWRCLGPRREDRGTTRWCSICSICQAAQCTNRDIAGPAGITTQPGDSAQLAAHKASRQHAAISSLHCA